MCGIVAYIGHFNAVDILIPALKRLEYRGYDSAGLATINGHGLGAYKAPGKIANLEALLARGNRPSGTLGIAHTRWATHGRPSEVNCHPHVDCHGRLAVVHNGIIENHNELRASLTAEGHRFRSQTDTEVIAHLIERHRSGPLPDAVGRAVRELKGSYAIACISEEDPHVLVGVRGAGSPLVVGVGHGEAFLASDVPALLGRSREVIVLEEGELATLTRDGVALQRLDGTPVHRRPAALGGDIEAVERGGWPHFMLKEIFEQPHVVRQMLAEQLDALTYGVGLDDLRLEDRELRALSRVCFVACGTSWHAALIAKYLIGQLAELPVDAEIASELRHCCPPCDRRVLAVAISQSGETADTLAAARRLRHRGAHVLAISNAVGSSVAREAGGVLYTRAGLEIGVAATKTFTAQVVAITLLAMKLGIARGTADRRRIARIRQALREVPALMEKTLEQSHALRCIAERVADRDGFLYLGRGLHYPMALEGALKLKEISYLHAEGYPGGEMKHGPIALIDSRTPVVALALSGPTSASMASNIQEVRARDGFVIAAVTQGDETIGSLAHIQIPLPPAPYWVHPFLLAIPLQLFAYHLAVLRGADVDQPRNLAKSVTVE
ncbi:MAG: glutamine--fructose-6-phosphate transaminase (isomerizing) [Acidobacteria bacterium]|nr:glutamine--fructose-6-phosphate transaminase (isomerizing) [Acidobacteriota bacterium]